MLPTLLFIIWAYGMYALISTITGRKGNRLRGRSPWRRYGWLGLVAGAGAGLGLAVVLAQSFDDQPHKLKLSGFMGTVWAEGWPDRVEQRQDYPPIKRAAEGDQPVYASLHPGTSPAELAQEKTGPKPRPAQKPKMRHNAASQAKGGKAGTQVAKKDKGAAKNKAKTAKKKKPAPPAAADKKSSARAES